MTQRALVRPEMVNINAIVPLIHQHTYEKHPTIRFLNRKPPTPVSDVIKAAPGEEALQINTTCAFPSICVRSPPSLRLYPSNTILAFWEAAVRFVRTERCKVAQREAKRTRGRRAGFRHINSSGRWLCLLSICSPSEQFTFFTPFQNTYVWKFMYVLASQITSITLCQLHFGLTFLCYMRQYNIVKHVRKE